MVSKNCRKPFHEVTYNSDDPPSLLLKDNKNVLIRDECEDQSKPIEIFFPIADSDQAVLQSNLLLTELSLPQLNAQLGDSAYRTTKVTPSLDTCSTHNFLAMNVFDTIPEKEKYILRKLNITVPTGRGKQSTLQCERKYRHLYYISTIEIGLL